MIVIGFSVSFWDSPACKPAISWFRLWLALLLLEVALAVLSVLAEAAW